MKTAFQDPADINRGLDLWMVNDHLTDEEIVHQVNEFREKGLSSVIFRTYNGLYSDYPGEGFKHSVRVAIDAAAKVGLKIVLQAGFMPSAFPALPKEYTLHKIVPTPVASLKGDERILEEHDGIAYVDAIARAALNMLDDASTDYYIRVTYEEMWADFRADFGKTVTSVWVDEPRFDSRFLVWSPDLGDRFAAARGYRIEEKIHELYLDEGDYKRTRYDYFTYLRDRMAECYYTKIRAWCHQSGLSFSGHLMGEELLRNQVSQAVAVMPFYHFFDIPGVDMLGGDADWFDHPFRPERYDQIGTKERSFHISALQCSSEAAQSGIERVLCEMYGVTSTAFGFRDLEHIFDFFAAVGVNYQCMHAFFYSISGFRKRFYPQQFNVYQPFWGNFRNLKDYVARVSAFMSMGKPQADVLLLHPLETAYGLYRGLFDEKDHTPHKAINEYDERHYRTVAALYASQIPFHFGDASRIACTGRVEGGEFIVGAMRYRAVILPEIETLTSPVLALLERFSAAGGTVLVRGAFPSRLDGREAPDLPARLGALSGVSRVDTDEELLALLAGIGRFWRYDADTRTSETVVGHRLDGDTHYFIVHNGDCRSEKRGTLTLSGVFRASRFDAERNVIEPLEAILRDGETVIRFTNPVGGSTLIIAEPAESLPLAFPPAAPKAILPLEGFSVCADRQNLLTLETASYKIEGMEDFSAEYAIEEITERFRREVYSGEVTLRFTFSSEVSLTGLHLIAEEPEKCVFALDGVEFPVCDEGYFYAAAFRKLRFPDVAPGRHILTVTRQTAPQVQRKINDDMTHLFELFRSPVGVDLERVHLLGDFSVRVMPQIATLGFSRYGKWFSLAAPRPVPAVADITKEGYPFYVGGLRYEALFTVPAEFAGKAVSVIIGDYHAASVNVFLDGVKVGSIDRDPYALPLPALSAGEHRLALELFGTLRNAIGPSHLFAWENCSQSRATWIRNYAESDIRDYDTKDKTPDFQQIPFGIGDIKLSFEM